jgi:hypothetical protein
MINQGLMSELPGQPSRRSILRRWLLIAAGLIAVIPVGVAVYVTLGMVAVSLGLRPAPQR